MNRPHRTVAIDDLRTLMETLLHAVGVEGEAARTAANVFLEADLRGNQMQGLDHMHTMLRNLQNGNADPTGRPRVVREGPAFALVDGGRGPGQLAAILAADVAVEKAGSAGSAVVGITRSSDIYMIGFYAERIARAGLVGLSASTGGPVARAHGGAEPALGTNPISFAIPTAGEHPIVLDMATSTLSGSRVRFADAHGEELEPGAGLGPDGLPTRDPARAREGGISTLGGHKGFGLSLFVALLCGPLTGSDVGTGLLGWGWKVGVPGEAGSMGHFIAAIDPGVFGDADDVRERVSAYARAVTGSRPGAGADPVLVPGERAFAERERNLRQGRVSLYTFIWEETSRIAADLGVTMPEAD